MKGIKLKNGMIVMTDIPEPKIRSLTEVKVKIAYVSICGYEMSVYNGKFPGMQDLNLGHEASGTVVEIGKHVEGIQVGDRVTLSPYSYCGYCSNCKKGLLRFCSNQYKSISSFMKEYAVLDQSMVYKLHERISLEEGCLIEPLSVSLRAVEKARIGCNKKLLIVGAGAMGLLALQAALCSPVEGVAVIDPNRSKRELALKLGAEIALESPSEELYYQLMDYTNGDGFDAVIETSGNSGCVPTAFNLLARGGSLVLLSIYESDYRLPISTLSLYYKDATIQAVYPTVEAFSKAVNLAPRLQLGSLITKIYPYEEAAKAFQRKSTGGDYIKVLLKFDGSL